MIHLDQVSLSKFATGVHALGTSVTHISTQCQLVTEWASLRREGPQAFRSDPYWARRLAFLGHTQLDMAYHLLTAKPMNGNLIH